MSDYLLPKLPNELRTYYSCLRYALKELNLLGEDMHYVPLEEIGIMRNLRSVGLSKVRNYGSVTPRQASP